MKFDSYIVPPLRCYSSSENVNIGSIFERTAEQNRMLTGN